jgi:hypothetical protein
MTVETLLQEVRSLPISERARLFEELHRLEDASVPESFWRGMADCQAGRVMEMEEALRDLPPPAV